MFLLSIKNSLSRSCFFKKRLDVVERERDAVGRERGAGRDVVDEVVDGA